MLGDLNKGSILLRRYSTIFEEIQASSQVHWSSQVSFQDSPYAGYGVSFEGQLARHASQAMGVAEVLGLPSYHPTMTYIYSLLF